MEMWVAFVFVVNIILEVYSFVSPLYERRKLVKGKAELKSSAM